LSESLPVLSRLESVCTFIAYRGFESHPVRSKLVSRPTCQVERDSLFLRG